MLQSLKQTYLDLRLTLSKQTLSPAGGHKGMQYLLDLPGNFLPDISPTVAAYNSEELVLRGK